MDHGIADFHTGGIAVEQQAPGFLLQQADDGLEALQICRLGQQGGGQLAVQALQRLVQLGFVGHLDHHGGGAEDFFLQQLVVFQQQAHVGLE